MVIHRLDLATINSVVTRKSPGCYKLYRVKTGPVRYVGRSDSDVSARLKDHENDGIYSYFEFKYRTSPKAAFDCECNLWHRHIKTIENYNKHPQRPTGKGWKCPRCNIYN